MEFLFVDVSTPLILDASKRGRLSWWEHVSCISWILFVVPLRRRQKWLKATRRGDIVVELLGSYYVYFLFFLLDFAC